MKCTLYCLATAALVLAISLNFIITSITPPKVEKYAKILRNGKIVIDKELLESVADQYPPILATVIYWLGNDKFAKWLLPLTEESIVPAARSRAGLGSDAPFWIDKENNETLLGPPDKLESYANTYWHKFLKILLKALEDEAQPYLSFLGRLAVRDTIIQGLAIQMRIVDVIKKHPEILEEKINKPIVIAGPPRTMTTHAQSILARHPDTFHIRIAEQLDPFYPEGLDPALVYTEADPRTKQVEYIMLFLKFVRPFFKYMFRLEEDRPANTVMEDVLPMALTFGAPTYEVNTYIPSYSNAWHSSDNKPSYRFLKLYQQVVQWQWRNGEKVSKNDPRMLRKHWIMKSPEHAGFLKDLMVIYPDAMVIITHRDPVPVAQSFIPLLVYFSGFWNSHVDASLLGEYQLRALENRLNHFVEQYGLVPAEQILHIPFKEFVDDNLGGIKKMCKFAGLSLDHNAMEPMNEYIQRSPREGANRFEYHIETLGENFTAAKLKERFSRYTSKFAQYL
jgi:hypothetical protein